MSLSEPSVDIRTVVARLRRRDLDASRAVSRAQVDSYVTRRIFITRRRERVATAASRLAWAAVALLTLWIAIPVTSAVIARSL